MQMINQAWLTDVFPEEFHNRLIRDDNGDYWISCRLRSTFRNNDGNYYPKQALVVAASYSVAEDGTIIYEDEER